MKIAIILGITHSGNIESVGTFTGILSLDRKDSWKLHRRAKEFLAMRSPDSPSLRDNLDFRRVWNQNRPVDNLLDLFPSLKYSYSSTLPSSYRTGKVNLVRSESSKSKARVDDIARSHSIRLDPIDAPKELYKYRLRVQSIISWAYHNNFVPVMMTLTVFHRWHNLAGLYNVISRARTALFNKGTAGLRIRDAIDLQGYVNRLEETINDGDGYNSGWHPHYHVLLI